jgi:hypothetical protein
MKGLLRFLKIIQYFILQKEMISAYHISIRRDTIED